MRALGRHVLIVLLTIQPMEKVWPEKRKAESSEADAFLARCKVAPCGVKERAAQQREVGVGGKVRMNVEWLNSSPLSAFNYFYDFNPTEPYID